jgi:hypothetical protein
LFHHEIICFYIVSASRHIIIVSKTTFAQLRLFEVRGSVAASKSAYNDCGWTAFTLYLQGAIAHWRNIRNAARKRALLHRHSSSIHSPLAIDCKSVELYSFMTHAFSQTSFSGREEVV